MVVPVDADDGETQDVDKQGRHAIYEPVDAGGDRGLQVERHNGDDHSHNAVAEGLQAMGVHGVTGLRSGSRFSRLLAHQRRPANLAADV